MPTKREQLEAAGRWLRDQRESHGYATAVDFARALGVDQSLVSRYERGISEVSDERAAKIAELFGMDLVETRRGLGLWVPSEPGQEQTLVDPEEPLDLELPAELRKNPDFMTKWRKVPRRKKRWMISEMRRRGEQRRREERENIVMLVNAASDELT